MFAHSLLPLHAHSRPQPRRIDSLAPTVPGHYVCTPAEPKEVSDRDYFSVWHSTPSSSSSAYPDTPGSVYSEPDTNDFESEKLPAAPVRPLSFPPARGIPARKPKSRAVADVRRLEAAAEGWNRRADDRGRESPAASEHLSSAFSDASSGSTTLASTPSMLSDISPVLVAWTSPAPPAVGETVERVHSAPVVEERLPREDPGDGVGNAVDAEGSGTRSQSQSHFNVALRAGWGFLPTLCSLKGVSLL